MAIDRSNAEISGAYEREADLVRACLAGDPSARERLVHRYARLVYSITHHYPLLPSDREDVFQTVFLRLFRRLPSLRDETRISSWLITTAYRECWRTLKNAGRYTALDTEELEAIGDESSETAAWRRHHAVHRALCLLGGRCEKLLHALFLQRPRPSYQDLSRRLGIAVGSIGPTRARCLERLEAVLEEMGFPDEDAASD